jgi:hypothetical protein
VNEVACCSYTRMKCGVITWAHCTRVASVKAPRTGCTGPTEAVDCVCAVCAQRSRMRAAQVRACAERRIAIDPVDCGRSRGIR